MSKEPYAGRWSRLVARDFLSWLGVPANKDWLDVGCGSGALTQAILEHAKPRSVRGFSLSNAQELPVESGSFDAVVAALVLNVVPKPERAVAEMARAARSGGIVAVYVWDYAGKMELIRYFWDAAMALDAKAFALDEGRRFPLCAPAPLSDLFADGGLPQIEVRAIDVPTRFGDFDDYWSAFLGGQGPAPRYAMSLSEERRGALRERIRSRLPIETNGSFALLARAWAVRAQVPQ
jgi:SAM-dependent methyltransferase